MQREDVPEPTESGLSTEDLAQPRDPGGGSEGIGTPGGPGGGGGPDVPAFPGEGTSLTEDTTEPPAAEPADAEPGPTEPGPTEPESEPEPASESPSESGPDEPSASARQEDEAPQLLNSADAAHFRERWQDIQNQFVDDPREAVHTADALVADLMRQLASNFAEHKQDLEGQWNRGEEANTEDLRMALRKYRSFFNRLLSA
ncbi:hypothetical protein [Streptomyces sp. NPDC006368]|uniref:hypothetical protein n=1 Tax=Streptomyces sp. NPDC006368 TaxID=3156760 RepID=UPI0033A3E938